MHAQRSSVSGVPILTVKDLKVSYATARGLIRAVNGVDFTLGRGERLGLVGESGSGKSTTAFALMRLIKPPGRIECGQVDLDGRDLMTLTEDEIRRVRFSEIALVPQGAMNSLNPVMVIREQIADVIRAHQGLSRGHSMKNRVAELLEWVELSPDVANLYAHELSGGMKQRVCIAIAISLRPKVIIADEPSSALDVVVQRQVFETLERVQMELGASVILVGHDMGLMAQFVDRIGVMYAGKLVEVAAVNDLFANALHPYSQALIGSLPSLEQQGVFRGIPGLTPSLLDPPRGCPFHPRCPHVFVRCRSEAPLLREIKSGRWVSCHLYSGGEA